MGGHDVAEVHLSHSINKETLYFNRKRAAIELTIKQEHRCYGNALVDQCLTDVLGLHRGDYS